MRSKIVVNILRMTSIVHVKLDKAEVDEDREIVRSEQVDDDSKLEYKSRNSVLRCQCKKV